MVFRYSKIMQETNYGITVCSSLTIVGWKFRKTERDIETEDELNFTYTIKFIGQFL